MSNQLDQYVEQMDGGNGGAALAVAEESTALTLPADLDLSVAGEENLERGDIGMPPRLRISQQNRPIENTQPGQIVNTLTGGVFDAVEFVPMVFLPTTRVMWPQTFSADNQPVCVSDDGKYPLNDLNRATEPQSGPCAQCPYGQFGEDSTPPACKAQRNFLLLGLPDYEPVILTLSSTGIAAAKQLTALAKMAGLRKTITMTTRQVNSDKGTWFAPVFIVGRKLATEETLMAVEFRNDLQNLIITADVEGNGSSAESAPIEDDEPVPF